MNYFQNQSLALYQAGLDASVDMMESTLRGAGRMRAHQFAIIRQIFAKNAVLAAQINNAMHPEDLLAAYVLLAETQFRNMSGYWNGIQRVMAENQAELFEGGQAQMTEVQRQFETSLDASAHGGAEPMAEAVKATVTAISSGLGTLARAAAQTAKLAGAQIESANEATQSATETTASPKPSRRSSGKSGD